MFDVVIITFCPFGPIGVPLLRGLSYLLTHLLNLPLQHHNLKDGNLTSISPITRTVPILPLGL